MAASPEHEEQIQTDYFIGFRLHTSHLSMITHLLSEVNSFPDKTVSMDVISVVTIKEVLKQFLRLILSYLTFFYHNL